MRSSPPTTEDRKAFRDSVLDDLVFADENAVEFKSRLLAIVAGMLSGEGEEVLSREVYSVALRLHKRRG